MAGRLSTLTHGPGGSLLADLAYGYDVLGNITAITEPSRNRGFTYDDLERLITGGTATEPESYAYDAVGNRTTSYLSAAHATNTANRLTGDDAFTYTYDANGNLASKTDTATGLLVTGYQYDALDRMVQITFPDATTATYRYDALGRRIEKNTNGTITRYVYDGGDIGFEYDGANALQTRYSHGDRTDQPLAQERGGATYYYHADHQGSVIALTDAAGAVVNDYEYDSYGRLLAAVEGITNPYTFTGRELDSESGLYYYRARYYDPDTGRFLAQDSIGFAAGDANLYRYVGSNPVNWNDPYGLAKFCRRPLDGEDFMAGPFYHSQIFYKDGDNIGFFPEGLLKDTKYKQYHYVCEKKEYDDAIVKEIVDEIERNMDQQWRVGNNNCQDFIDAVKEDLNFRQGVNNEEYEYEWPGFDF